jgi:hypothetical protein
MRFDRSSLTVKKTARKTIGRCLKPFQDAYEYNEQYEVDAQDGPYGDCFGPDCFHVIDPEANEEEPEVAPDPDGPW